MQAMFKLENKRSPLCALRKKAFVIPTTLVILYLLASAIRINYLGSSLLISEVQYRSALIARKNYFSLVNDVPEWRLIANSASTSGLHQKEPSVMEFMVSRIYWVLGKEDPNVGRLLASTFWLLAGFVLFSTVKSLHSVNAALISLAYFLFLPLGIHLSISFTADSLMVLLFLASLYAIFKYFDMPSMPRLFIAAILSGLSIFVKPLGMFAIFGAFLTLTLSTKSKRERPIDGNFFIFYIICLLPVFFYYLYDILITQTLADQAQLSFLPRLLLEREYWKGWFSTAIQAVGFTPMVLGLLGLPLLRRDIARALIVGLLGGYVVFCLVFTYHIRYATYYHSQLIVIVALTLGPFISTVVHHLRDKISSFHGWAPVMVAILIVMIFSVRLIRQEFNFPEIENRETAQQIGNLVKHSTSTAYLASYYGRPLEYYAEISGVYWPRKDTHWAFIGSHEKSLSVLERIQSLGFIPEYFIITDFDEFSRHHEDLRQYLQDQYHLLAKKEHYLIYQLHPDP